MSADTEPNDQATDLHPLIQQRIANRESLRQAGQDPYGSGEPGLMSLAAAHGRYDESADEDQKANGKAEGFVDKRPVVTVAGRVILSRDNGKLIWLNLRDDSGDLQVAVSKRDCDEAGFAAAKLLDNADLVIATGPLTKTKTGEVTVWASSLRMASKSLVPPPEKWAGLQDVESRYRKRYVDLWANPDAMRVFQLRSKIVAGIRRLMDARGFIEVETPMLQTQAGGAAARPFVTHMNALDIDLSMRIAPELYLKRLLVGGMRKVYEINRNFRNEGVDKQHNPEFTAIEAYEAFGNYHSVMELSEAIVRHAASIVSGSDENLTLPFGDLTIDYAKPFERVTYAELFERALGFAMSDTAKVHEAAKKHHIKTASEDGTPMDDVWVSTSSLRRSRRRRSIRVCRRGSWIIRLRSARSRGPGRTIRRSPSARTCSSRAWRSGRTTRSSTIPTSSFSASRSSSRGSTTRSRRSGRWTRTLSRRCVWACRRRAGWGSGSTVW